LRYVAGKHCWWRRQLSRAFRLL